MNCLLTCHPLPGRPKPPPDRPRRTLLGPGPSSSSAASNLPCDVISISSDDDEATPPPPPSAPPAKSRNPSSPPPPPISISSSPEHSSPGRQQFSSISSNPLMESPPLKQRHSSGHLVIDTPASPDVEELMQETPESPKTDGDDDEYDPGLATTSNSAC